MTTAVPGNAVRILLVGGVSLLQPRSLPDLDASEAVEVVGRTGRVDSAIELLHHLGPDVVIVDIDDDGLPGFEACALLSRARQHCRVLAVSACAAGEPSAERALAAGAHGLLSRYSALDEVITGARAVNNGCLVLGSDLATGFVARLHGRSGRSVFEEFPTLTRREREILELLAQGLDNRSIARRLFLSDKTIRNHVSTVLGKLGAKSRVQAVVRARRAGMGLAAPTRQVG
ncbi:MULTISPECIES: response regulator transcription factor [unclassified Streptomyces]|uniref:response regulator transcription factor n=1 Tax=unclassified Streptomyces TaxID=2593676 RepID=UPI0008DE9E71|nr:MULTISPECIES: response regulator transcription factor [unclassified Streptomyces]OII69385.1 hypothetical protein BJP39_04145 [Streptomyces sp. CC77]